MRAVTIKTDNKKRHKVQRVVTQRLITFTLKDPLLNLCQFFVAY